MPHSNCLACIYKQHGGCHAKAFYLLSGGFRSCNRGHGNCCGDDAAITERDRSLTPRTRRQDRSRLHRRQNDATVFRRRDFVPKFWFSRSDPSGTPSPDTPAARIKRAYKLRQQPAETPTASAARGSFLWRQGLYWLSRRDCWRPWHLGHSRARRSSL